MAAIIGRHGKVSRLAVGGQYRKRTRLVHCAAARPTAIISGAFLATSSIAAFHDAGLKISVDDYGAGLSSLSYLKQIAADELKLDRSLIRDLSDSARDCLIVKSTIDLAHGLGMAVVAEGVEDEGTSATLGVLGCDAIQGYYIARPMPLDMFVPFVRDWRAGQLWQKPDDIPAKGAHA